MVVTSNITVDKKNQIQIERTRRPYVTFNDRDNSATTKESSGCIEIPDTEPSCIPGSIILGMQYSNGKPDRFNSIKKVDLIA